MKPCPSRRAAARRTDSRRDGLATRLFGGTLLAAALLLFACGDDPKPGPGPGAGQAGPSPSEVETDPAQRPRVDAFRKASGWRLTISPPLAPIADFRPTTALIEDRDGQEIARAPFAAGGVGFDLDRSGPIRCVLMNAAGRRLQRDFELP